MGWGIVDVVVVLGVDFILVLFENKLCLIFWRIVVFIVLLVICWILNVFLIIVLIIGIIWFILSNKMIKIIFI